MTLAHTIDETLGKFDLVSGGGDGETTACTLTALSWANGDAWTDNIPCAHQTLRYAVIAANDAPYTTADQRAELVRLGAPTDEREGGILDTWWIPITVIAYALSIAGKDATRYGRARTAVEYLSGWKVTKEQIDLGSADLSGANLGGADLSGANLGGANLGGADLEGANLRNANLRSANLRDANLRGANLRSADLGDADLRNADLRSADLGDADLRNANLRNADLRTANLGGADLRNANLGGADLGGADLRNAKATTSTSWPDGFDPAARGVVVV